MRRNRNIMRKSQELILTLFFFLGFFFSVENIVEGIISVESVRTFQRLDQPFFDEHICQRLPLNEIISFFHIIQPSERKVNTWRISGGNVSDRRRVAALFLLQNCSKERR